MINQEIKKQSKDIIIISLLLSILCLLLAFLSFESGINYSNSELLSEYQQNRKFTAGIIMGFCLSILSITLAFVGMTELIFLKKEK